MNFNLTTVIIVITAITSISAFNNRERLQGMLFSPYVIKRNGEYHRFFTSGLVHGSWIHLLFNMFVLYSFGIATESYFEQIFGAAGKWLFLVLYILGIILSEVYSYFQHQDNPHYASLGASGAVSAVVFASILINPWMGIVFIFFPFFPIPGFVIGILYLLYSAYMAKNSNDNIGHYAHFFGAIFGFVFPLLFKPKLIIDFFNDIINGLPL